MMPGAKVINHDVLAHEWLYDLMTRPNMRIKVGCIPHDIRILGKDCGSAKHETIRMASFDLNIIYIKVLGIENHIKRLHFGGIYGIIPMLSHLRLNCRDLQG